MMNSEEKLDKVVTIRKISNTIGSNSHLNSQETLDFNEKSKPELSMADCLEKHQAAVSFETTRKRVVKSPTTIEDLEKDV